MEKILNCPRCGQFPLKYSQSLHLYFCTDCLSVYEKFGDELELICSGEDEEEALAALVACIDDRLGE